MIRGGSRRTGPDMVGIREAVRGLVESGRGDEWFARLSDNVLVALAAPLEMLTFQYYLDPPRDRHLLRAVRVACQAMEGQLADCPDDLAAAFRRLNAALEGAVSRSRRERT